MLALVLIKNKCLKLLKVKQKKLLKKQYKIKINYTGICASDIPRAYSNGAYNYPLIMGHEFCGTIVQCGKEAKKYKKNDFVSAYPLVPKCKKCNSCKFGNFQLCKNYSYYGSREDGSMSEYLNVNEWNIFKLQKGVPPSLGCLMEPIAVAFNIFKNIINRDSKILILGSGFIGLILSGILNSKKFSNIDVLDRNAYKLSKLPNKNFKKLKYSLNFFNIKKKYDYTIDLIGNEESFQSCLDKTKESGVILLAANIYKNINISKKSLNLILRKELTIKGIWNSTFKKYENNWDQAQDFILKNKNWILSLISHKVSLKESKNIIKKIFYKKNFSKNKNFKYIKGVIKNNQI
jgi:L-iditol 2-dehydrogenase